MKPQVIDNKARAMAQAVGSKISEHEKVCAERQGHILTGICDIKGDVAALFTRFWVAACSLIVTLLGVCASLVYLILSKPH